MNSIMTAIVLLAVVLVAIHFYMKWAANQRLQREENEKAARKRERDDLIVAQVRQKQKSGEISTGLMMSLGDGQGGLSTEVNIAGAWIALKEKYRDNPRALAGEISRFWQSVLQQTLVVPDEAKLSTCYTLTIKELVRHMIGTWSIDPDLFKGRYLKEVDIQGTILDDQRVEITPEMIFEASQENELVEKLDAEGEPVKEMRVPLKGRLMDRKVHAARMHEQMLGVAKPGVAVGGTTHTQLGGMQTIEPASLETANNTDELPEWYGKLPEEFGNGSGRAK